MGTSGAWGGSGGRDWSQVRRDVSDLVSAPSPDRAEKLMPNLGDAMDWLDAADPPGAGSAEALPTLTPLPVGPSWASRPSGSGGGGGGGVGGARAGSHGGRTASARAPSTGRSRRRAAVVGGQVLGAGLAYRSGDAETLRELGLDLGELRSLSGARRMNRILNAVVGADGGIEETELRAVNSRVLRAILVDGIGGADAVRLYIVEYVMQVYASEAGDAMHTGVGSGEASADAERQLRGVLRARVRQLDVPEAVTPTALREAISRALGLMRRVMRRR